MAEQQQQEEAGRIHLQRSSSRNGPQQLLRTMSQKMKSFLVSPPHSKTPSCGNLFLDHLGECRCRVTPEAKSSEEAPDLQKTTSSTSNTKQLAKSSSHKRWLLKFSSGRDRSLKHQGMPLDSDSIPEPRGGCFRFDTRCFRSARAEEQTPHQQQEHQSLLPDDLLEMSLARLPFDSLVRARAVCRKWNSLTRTSHFLQLRERIQVKSSSDSWLFLLGLSRDGICSGQIQALDPRLDKWHTIQAELLSGRLLYSAAAFGTKIFVVGGCSARPTGDKGGFLKTHTSVLLLEPVSGKWSRLPDMKSPRTTPVVASFEMKHPLCSVKHHEQQQKQQQNEIGVFKPGSSSSRSFRLIEIVARRCMHKSCSERELSEAYQELQESERRRRRSLSSSSCSSSSNSSRFGLIVVGGRGEWNEAVFSGEVYDSELDSWREISAWPAEFGAISTGVVLDLVFYAYTDADKLLAYDLEQDSWREIRVSSALTRLHEYLPRLVICGGRILLLGVAWDSREAKAARKVWKLDELLGGERRWIQISQHPDAPLDWNAVFVGHRDRIYGVEMFRIFGQVLDFVTVSHHAGGEITSWDRASRHRMAQEMDASCCITKTAVVVQL